MALERIYNKAGRTLLGLQKVLERQKNKPSRTSIDFGMNTYRHYTNPHILDCDGLQDAIKGLKWQPLKYVICPVPHTVYTYKLHTTPHVNAMRRKLANINHKN